MKRKEEILNKAIEFVDKNYMDVGIKTTHEASVAACQEIAEWADENPDKNNVYTKQELREMGFGFTLNGDIVTPKEEEEMTEKYIKYKQKHLIDKACEWLETNLLNYWSQCNANNTKDFINDFKKQWRKSNYENRNP